MAKANDTRRRGARPTAAVASGNGSAPQDQPLRTTGYSLRSADNGVRNVVLSVAAALVFVLLFMSYNYDSAYIPPSLRAAADEEGISAYPRQESTAKTSTNVKKLSEAAEAKLKTENVVADMNDGVDENEAQHHKEEESKPAVPKVEPPNPYKRNVQLTDDANSQTNAGETKSAAALSTDAATPSAEWPASTKVRIYHGRKDCEGTNFTEYETSKEVDETDPKTDAIAIPNGYDPKNGDPTGKSMQIIGPGELKLYNQQGHYVATFVEMEGCLPIFPWPPIRKGILAHRKTDPGKHCQIDPQLQKQFSTAKDLAKPHTRIVYSAESSDYFGYQTLSNAFAFLNSSQTEASWIRLLTCETPDDLAKSYPTFTAPRSSYSKRYGPINKPDVIEKWFASECDAPHPDDNIVVIDPDNFLMRDMKKWTDQVSRKNALGQAAYYVNSPKVKEMWKEVCLEGCDNEVDRVGVPYVVKAADLKEIAPLWRYYTFKVKELVQTDENFKDRFEKYLNVMWAAEMFGYNYACAHLGIKTKVMHDMQARDVDASIPLDSPEPPAMIHMGRAWFPKEHANAAEPFRHTEGKDFLNGNNRAVQVFCKCNQTASTVLPWPIPEKGLDWQSYHTLRIMHDGVEHFGGVPENELFRHKPPDGYYWTKN